MTPKIRRILTFPARLAAHILIPSWLDDGSPSDWRARLICWAWGEDDRASNPGSWDGSATDRDDITF